MKVSLTVIENCYLALCVFVFYAFKAPTASAAILAGVSSCLLFIPSYRVLIVGAPMAPVKLLVRVFLFKVVCLVLLRTILDEQKINEMCILFVVAHLAAKPLRFLLVVTARRVFEWR